MNNLETSYNWEETLIDTWPHLYIPSQISYNNRNTENAMIGNLEPEETVMNLDNENLVEQINSAIKKLGWNLTDDICVDIGGVAATGTATHPDANPKWAKPFGSITYQNDAFIIIKNRNRNPVVPSQPNPDLKQHHA